MRGFVITAALISATTVPPQAQAQESLAKRVTQTDGAVQVIYPSRAGACGDGSSYISNILGADRTFANGSMFSRGSWQDRPCIPGPARVGATVIDGEITRLRAYVGPVPASDVRTIQASAVDARRWLEGIIASTSERAARDAALPLILAEGTNPWPLFLRVARDEQRPLSTRRAMLNWLVYAVDDRLGLANASAETDDDEMAKQAVFVLAQRAKHDGIAELMDLARTAKRPAVRRDAIFWLSQSGDVRQVADLYADLLK